MSDENRIDWGVEETAPRGVTIKLQEIHMDESHEVEIVEMKNTKQGYIVCTVNAPTLNGDTLWLKGSYGLQNGAISLMRLVNSDLPSDYEGKSFMVGKVPSEQSSSGYRYEWGLVVV
tara:strand:+ start:5189 stop:5539 length:351 start_codon:yes stop_codon:yes gene_type:complete